jgi:large subunit ribosomal protein L17
MLRNLATALICNGRIVTTEARAKEIRPIVEKFVTLAIAEYKNCETVTVKKQIKNKDGVVETVEREVVKDNPSKLHARRQMMAYLYDVPEPRLVDENGKLETKAAYKERTKDRRHVAIEKLFRDLAPKYDGRNGGYTHILKLGPRRGDGAEQVVIEFVD